MTTFFQITDIGSNLRDGSERTHKFRNEYGFDLIARFSEAAGPILDGNDENELYIFPVFEHLPAGGEWVNVEKDYVYDYAKSLRRAKDVWIGNEMPDGPEKDAKAERLVAQKLERVISHLQDHWTYLEAHVSLYHPKVGNFAIEIVKDLPSDQPSVIAGELNRIAGPLIEKSNDLGILNTLAHALKKSIKDDTELLEKLVPVLS